MPKPNTRRPASAARAPDGEPHRAPDRIDRITGELRTITAALSLAKQAQRLPSGSARALRMLALSVRILEMLDARSAPAEPPAPADPAGPRP